MGEPEMAMRSVETGWRSEALKVKATRSMGSTIERCWTHRKIMLR
jgi:hypothetical protein